MYLITTDKKQEISQYTNGKSGHLNKETTKLNMV